MSSTRLIRSFNAISILKTLYREGSCTRSELTKLTKMSPSTVTRIITELIRQGVLSEGVAERSTGGRKPVKLHLEYSRLYIIGIQLLKDEAAIVISDLKGNFVEKRTFVPYALDADFLLRDVAHQIEGLLDSTGINREHIVGIGLAISGVVDSHRGIMLRSVNLGWRDVWVKKILEDILDIPVFLENDANAAALAEFWFGNAKDVGNLLYLKTEAGAGAGVVQNHKLLTGPRGMAGEIGHVPLLPEGEPCRCGQTGCLETYVYIRDVLERYQRLSGELLNKSEFFFRYTEGDPLAKQLVNQTNQALSKLACLAGTLLDLDMIIIGGIWGQLGDDFIRPIQEQCQMVLDKTGLDKSIIVRGSRLGDDCDLLGAVGLVIDQWFTPPIQLQSAR